MVSNYWSPTFKIFTEDCDDIIYDMRNRVNTSWGQLTAKKKKWKQSVFVSILKWYEFFLYPSSCIRDVSHRSVFPVIHATVIHCPQIKWLKIKCFIIFYDSVGQKSRQGSAVNSSVPCGIDCGHLGTSADGLTEKYKRDSFASAETAGKLASTVFFSLST